MAIYFDFEMPEDLYYHKDYTWSKLEAELVRVGFNDMFVNLTGDIIYVDLPQPGRKVKQGEACGKVLSRKYIGKIVSPLSGVILVTNAELLDEQPDIINKDPYGKGWLFIIKPDCLYDELCNLMQGSMVENWLRQEIARIEIVGKKIFKRKID